MSTVNCISSRPSQEQVTALIEFMDKNPDLAFGRLKCASGRAESKKLWFKLTRILNGLSGPTRPMKSWIKYWADKKAHVRNKIQGHSTGGTKTVLTCVEQKIWNKFLADENDGNQLNSKTKFKNENNTQDDIMQYKDEFRTNEGNGGVMTDPELEVHPVDDYEDRYIGIMSKLIEIMEDQSTSLATIAQSAEINTNTIDKLAKAALTQARAVDRLANSIASTPTCTQHIRNALIGVNNTMERLYPSAPT